MKINSSKCRQLNVTNKKITSYFQYSILNQVIKSVSSYKYLGVYFFYNLFWKKRTEHIISDVSWKLGFFKRNIHSAPQTTKLRAYKTNIVPKLEYACIIPNPHQNYLTLQLEAFQNKGARFDDIT